MSQLNWYQGDLRIPVKEDDELLNLNRINKQIGRNHKFYTTINNEDDKEADIKDVHVNDEEEEEKKLRFTQA